ncbi:MAG: type II toxin-antitoxin system VapC family toxin [Lautropia sp.]|nr:type II toxin-antitoxin system VapC family toxin [Lautropia sp.]
MIILDTNVVSEVIRPTPDTNVLAWLDSRHRASLFTTTITRAELLYGVGILPEGQRKRALHKVVLDVLDIDLDGHVLGFDRDAADAFADIASLRKNAGRPITGFDAMIAAIARAHGASLATRNIKDFVDCGIELINPWQYSG